MKMYERMNGQQGIRRDEWMNRAGWRRQTGGVMDGRFVEERVLDGGWVGGWMKRVKIAE